MSFDHRPAPVAFIGGLSHAARHRIIVKTPAALEALTQAKTIFFDKTGTLTLGNPALVETVVLDHAYDMARALTLAAAIEYHSIHPLARALSVAREAARLPIAVARDVRETVGQGIAGVVNEQRYTITAAKPDGKGGILLAFSDGAHDIAHFRFEDVLKDDTGVFLKWIESQGMHVEILTGDSPENAERALGHFGIPIRAKTTPQDKAAAIARARAFGPVIMVGDGLNDAPALAHADVGIVFSGTENSAAIDAAAIAILGRDLGLIRELLEDARHTTQIAQESIWGGIILSVTGMLFAAFGHITPVVGALVQELIDVTVILNALRAAVADEYRPMTGTDGT
jgi:P-type E1-E2 ATPase